MQAKASNVVKREGLTSFSLVTVNSASQPPFLEANAFLAPFQKTSDCKADTVDTGHGMSEKGRVRQLFSLRQQYLYYTASFAIIFYP